MSPRRARIVLHYDGAHFAGWQRQPHQRTVQGALESVLERLFGAATAVTGAGRTDAGVHARGQVAHVDLPERWSAEALRKAANALLPHDLWVADAAIVAAEFHARYSAVARRYSYRVGMDEAADSPFRRRYEWHARGPMDVSALEPLAAALVGEHQFYGFAVRGTAPPGDDHRCNVTVAEWLTRDGGLTFTVEANRFLHHMVRFLVGTMIDVARGRRDAASFMALLRASDNRAVSPPAPAHGLCLELVRYPLHLLTLPV